jgi:hypothetical protein
MLSRFGEARSLGEGEAAIEDDRGKFRAWNELFLIGAAE